MPRFVLLNGPPKSGKTAIARQLLARHSVSRRGATSSTLLCRAISQELKERTHALYGLDVPHDYFDAIKDRPADCFLGRTPRETYIHVSERHFKPLHGDDVFGRLFIRATQHLPEKAIVIAPGVGFEAEIEPIIEAAGPRNIFLIHVERDGCDFSDDSRGWIRPIPEVNGASVENRDGELADVVQFLLGAIRRQFRDSFYPSADGTRLQYEDSSCPLPI